MNIHLLVGENQVGSFPAADFSTVVHGEQPGRVPGGIAENVRQSAAGVLHHVAAGGVQGEPGAGNLPVKIKVDVGDAVIAFRNRPFKNTGIRYQNDPGPDP